MIKLSDIDKCLLALNTLENLSIDYSYEMKYLSKRIRNDLWTNWNTRKLTYVITVINSVFSIISDITNREFNSLDLVLEYVRCLAIYPSYYNSRLSESYFENLITDIKNKNFERITEKQWEDITIASNGYKSFLSTFDDVFCHAINLHKSSFFHPLNNTDVLCRAVEGWNHKVDRFIPWASKTNNRWNPPGKQFLYLSFSKNEKMYNDDLTVNEYICLEELRAQKGKLYSFCHFKPTVSGNILDLSYNDVSMDNVRQELNVHCNKTIQEITKKYFLSYRDKSGIKDDSLLKKEVLQLTQQSPISKDILEETLAKQYLKMICNCIYKKVDETDEKKLQTAYKSFHILSEYFESKGITGIIYPCTRTTKVVGKNLVLFDVNDAIPLEKSIREYQYN